MDVGSLFVDPATGVISADGGNDYLSGAGGGGGRIAIYHTQDVSNDSLQRIQAHGGMDATYIKAAGGLGSIYLERDGEAGQLIFNSHETLSESLALLGTPEDTSFEVEHLIIAGTNTKVATEHNMPIFATSVTIESGAVVQSNYHNYKALRMAQAPLIETHIINSGSEIGGAGEPGTPGIAPALTSAIYNATGVRVRRLPLNKNDIG